jgi:hypothetical protein
LIVGIEEKKMNKSLCIVSALFILMLSGCATNRVLTRIDSKQSPSPDSGYVAGMFSRDWEPGKLSFGLGIVNIETDEKYVMPFGIETVLSNAVVDQFGMIQIPPGEYRVAYWQTYSTKDKKQITQTSILPDSRAGLPFTLAPGEVVFIGSYVAKYERDNSTDGDKEWSVRHQQLALPLVQKALSRSYPEFVTQPLSCPSCLK